MTTWPEPLRLDPAVEWREFDAYYERMMLELYSISCMPPQTIAVVGAPKRFAQQTVLFRNVGGFSMDKAKAAEALSELERAGFCAAGRAAVAKLVEAITGERVAVDADPVLNYGEVWRVGDRFWLVVYSNQSPEYTSLVCIGPESVRPYVGASGVAVTTPTKQWIREQGGVRVAVSLSSYFAGPMQTTSASEPRVIRRGFEGLQMPTPPHCGGVGQQAANDASQPSRPR